MGGALPEFDHHHIKINKKGKKIKDLSMFQYLFTMNRRYKIRKEKNLVVVLSITSFVILSHSLRRCIR
jgi:hypothetical protein